MSYERFVRIHVFVGERVECDICEKMLKHQEAYYKDTRKSGYRLSLCVTCYNVVKSSLRRLSSK